MKHGGKRYGSVRVPNAELGYAIEGDGPPVLVVGSSVYYPRTFSRRLTEFCTLAFADLRHFVPSAPGFDASRLTFDEYADDIEAIRAAIGFERCVLAGHSKHGNIALEYAKRYPERVSGVALIGSPPCGLKEVQAARPAHWEVNASFDRKERYRRSQASLVPDQSPAEAVVAHYVADGPKYWFDPTYDAAHLWRDVFVNATVLDRVHDLFADYQFGWEPDQLRAPVLALAGRFDFAVPHVLWDTARLKLPAFAYALFERSGHTPQLEEPARFERLFLAWVRGESIVDL